MSATNGVAVIPTVAVIERPTTARELRAAWLLGYANAATRQAYTRDLAEWEAFVDLLGVDVLGAHRAHVETWARSLEAAGRSPATIRRKLAAVASYYAYAADEELIARSPVARVRRPKVADESPRLGLDRDELRRLVAAARQSGPRDTALVLLLALNGLRISEALGADVGDLGAARGHRVLGIVRKGGKKALVPLPPVVADAIDAMLDARGEVPAEPGEHGRDQLPLFATSSGRRVVPQAVWKMLRRLAREAGIEKPISAHTLRHAFCTLSLDTGAQLRDVQDAMGHQDPRTTRLYDRSRHSLDRHPGPRVAAAIADE